MIIPLDDGWRLKSDSFQWTVERRGRRRDEHGEWEDPWKAVGYYSDVGAAVRGLARRRVRECGAETLVEAIRQVEEIGEVLSTALTPSIRGVVRAELKGEV